MTYGRTCFLNLICLLYCSDICLNLFVGAIATRLHAVNGFTTTTTTTTPPPREREERLMVFAGHTMRTAVPMPLQSAAEREVYPPPVQSTTGREVCKWAD